MDLQKRIVEVRSRIEMGILLRQSNDRSARASAMAELERAIAMVEEGLLDGASEDEEIWVLVQQGKFELGNLYSIANIHPNTAIKYLKEGLSLGHDPATVHYYLGMSYMALEDLHESLHHLNTCISMNPTADPLRYVKCAKVHIHMNNFAKAIEMTVEAAKLAHACGDYFRESNYWAVAGSMERLHLHDYKSALEHLVSSLEAAFRVENLEEQASRLADASPHLKACVIQVSGFPCESFSSISSEEADEEEEAPKSINFLRAEAYCNLAVALLVFGSINRACKCFADGIQLLMQQQELKPHEKGLLFSLQYQHAESLMLSDAPQQALEQYEACKLTAPTARLHLMCDIQLVHCVKAQGCYRKSADMCASLLVKNATLLDSELDLKARLLFELGQSLLAIESTREAISNLKAAREIWETKVHPSTAASWLPWVLVQMFVAYMQIHQFAAAYDIATVLERGLEHNLNPNNEKIWKMVHAASFIVLGDHNTAEESLAKMLVSNENDALDWKEKCTLLLNLGNSYRRLGDWNAALAKYDETAACISQGIPSSDFILDLKAYIHLNRSALYRDMAMDAEKSGDMKMHQESCENWLTEAQQACSIYDSLNQGPSEKALAYLGQAHALYCLERYIEAANMLDKAAILATNNDLITAKVNTTRANMLFIERNTDEAESVGREAVLAFAEIQTRLGDMENAWITFLGNDMKIAFFLLQQICVEKKQPWGALLWAERSKMRLYFYLIGQRHFIADSASNDDAWNDPLRFDKDDKYALNCIQEAVRGLPPGWVVVEYSYAPDVENVMYIYVLYRHEEVSIKVKQMDIHKFFKVKNNAKLGKSLDAVVQRTRTAIARGKDDQAKIGLGILHAMLVGPIQELLIGCSAIIFAPHEVLSLVPFAALNDGQFLIETRAVGTIPSLRALHHCLARQQVFSKLANSVTAFVAGNPEPMGWNCCQLEGAAEEAIRVAKQLDTEAVIGPKMTKAVVLDNFSKAGIVVLSTHGLVNDCFPHGALVMQRKASCKQVSSNLVDMQLGGGLSRVVGEMLCKVDEEVLTAKEIEKLEIQAGIVVLSACQTGEGKVSREGLLGLGRALLQAGASCAVLTLWKVNDVSMPELITGMFQELLLENRSIVDALRISMLRMLHSGKSIYKWAPLVAFGSPTFCLSLKHLSQ